MNDINIKEKNVKELETVCEDIREEILRVVSKNGGHLSSTLGATEIIVAMHKVFDSKKEEETLEIEKAGCIRDAADICPVQCIIIKKDKT